MATPSNVAGQQRTKSGTRLFYLVSAIIRSYHTEINAGTTAVNTSNPKQGGG